MPFHTVTRVARSRAKKQKQHKLVMRLRVPGWPVGINKQWAASKASDALGACRVYESPLAAQARNPSVWAPRSQGSKFDRSNLPALDKPMESNTMTRGRCIPKRQICPKHPSEHWPLTAPQEVKKNPVGRKRSAWGERRASRVLQGQADHSMEGPGAGQHHLQRQEASARRRNLLASLMRSVREMWGMSHGMTPI